MKINKINNGLETYDIEDANAVHTSGDETITGVKTLNQIAFTNGYAIFRDSDTGALQILGGSDAGTAGKSGRLVLFGKNNSSTPSAVELRGDDSNKALLLLTGPSHGRGAHKLIIKAENGVEIDNGGLTASAGVVKGSPFPLAVLPKVGNRGEPFSYDNSTYFTVGSGTNQLVAQECSGWLVVQAKATNGVGVSIDATGSEVTATVTEAAIVLDGVVKQTARTIKSGAIISAYVPVAKGERPSVTLSNCASNFNDQEHIWFVKCDSDVSDPVSASPSASVQSSAD